MKSSMQIIKSSYSQKKLHSWRYMLVMVLVLLVFSELSNVVAANEQKQNKDVDSKAQATQPIELDNEPSTDKPQSQQNTVTTPTNYVVHKEGKIIQFASQYKWKDFKLRQIKDIQKCGNNDYILGQTEQGAIYLWKIQEWLNFTKNHIPKNSSALKLTDEKKGQGEDDSSVKESMFIQQWQQENNVAKSKRNGYINSHHYIRCSVKSIIVTGILKIKKDKKQSDNDVKEIAQLKTFFISASSFKIVSEDSVEQQTDQVFNIQYFLSRDQEQDSPQEKVIKFSNKVQKFQNVFIVVQTKDFNQKEFSNIPTLINIYGNGGYMKAAVNKQVFCLYIDSQNNKQHSGKIGCHRMDLSAQASQTQATQFKKINEIEIKGTYQGTYLTMQLNNNNILTVLNTIVLDQKNKKFQDHLNGYQLQLEDKSIKQIYNQTLKEKNELNTLELIRTSVGQQDEEALILWNGQEISIILSKKQFQFGQRILLKTKDDSEDGKSTHSIFRQLPQLYAIFSPGYMTAQKIQQLSVEYADNKQQSVKIEDQGVENAKKEEENQKGQKNVQNIAQQMEKGQNKQKQKQKENQEVKSDKQDDENGKEMSEKVDEKAEEKVEEKSEKVDEKSEEKVEEKSEKADEKSDENGEEKSEKADEKANQKVEEKVDQKDKEDTNNDDSIDKNENNDIEQQLLRRQQNQNNQGVIDDKIQQEQNKVEQIKEDKQIKKVKEVQEVDEIEEINKLNSDQDKDQDQDQNEKKDIKENDEQTQKNENIIKEKQTDKDVQKGKQIIQGQLDGKKQEQNKSNKDQQQGEQQNQEVTEADAGAVAGADDKADINDDGAEADINYDGAEADVNYDGANANTINTEAESNIRKDQKQQKILKLQTKIANLSTTVNQLIKNKQSHKQSHTQSPQPIQQLKQKINDFQTKLQQANNKIILLEMAKPWSKQEGGQDQQNQLNRNELQQHHSLIDGVDVDVDEEVNLQRLERIRKKLGIKDIQAFIEQIKDKIVALNQKGKLSEVEGKISNSNSKQDNQNIEKGENKKEDNENENEKVKDKGRNTDQQDKKNIRKEDEQKEKEKEDKKDKENKEQDKDKDKDKNKEIEEKEDKKNTNNPENKPQNKQEEDKSQNIQQDLIKPIKDKGKQVQKQQTPNKPSKDQAQQKQTSKNDIEDGSPTNVDEVQSKMKQNLSKIQIQKPGEKQQQTKPQTDQQYSLISFGKTVLALMTPIVVFLIIWNLWIWWKKRQTGGSGMGSMTSASLSSINKNNSNLNNLEDDDIDIQQQYTNRRVNVSEQQFSQSQTGKGNISNLNKYKSSKVGQKTSLPKTSTTTSTTKLPTKQQQQLQAQKEVDFDEYKNGDQSISNLRIVQKRQQQQQQQIKSSSSLTLKNKVIPKVRMPPRGVVNVNNNNNVNVVDNNVVDMNNLKHIQQQNKIKSNIVAVAQDDDDFESFQTADKILNGNDNDNGNNAQQDKEIQRDSNKFIPVVPVFIDNNNVIITNQNNQIDSDPFEEIQRDNPNLNKCLNVNNVVVAVNVNENQQKEQSQQKLQTQHQPQQQKQQKQQEQQQQEEDEFEQAVYVKDDDDGELKKNDKKKQVSQEFQKQQQKDSKKDEQ